MIDAEDRALLEETVRAALAEAEPGAAVDGVLAKLGWLDMLGAEPGDAVDIVFTALGHANARAAVLDDVVVAALGRKPHPDLAVLLPPFAAWDPPGRIEAGDLHARGLATARAATAGEMLVVCGTPAEPWIGTVPMTAAEVGPVGGVDPDAGLHPVHVQAGAGDAARLDVGAWAAAVALARRAAAHQIAGGSRAMLDFACTHAREREQFGGPIARFQAVQHRLAEALVAVEALEATLAAARDEPNPDTAALAKAVAGRTARTVAAQCQQVLAGIGFTTEHPFHRFLKRNMVLEGLFGSADAIVLSLGRQLLAARHVPTLIDL